MKIRFDEIPSEGLRLTIKDEAWFPDHDLSRDGGVLAVVFLRREGRARVLMEGTLTVTVCLTCDRCLESYPLPLEETFVVDFELADESVVASSAGEHLLGSNEMDAVFLLEPAIDIYQVLEQQVFLALPEKHLCAEQCRGLCGGCGVNLNEQDCRCGGEKRVSPFSVLAGLKQTKE